MNKKLLMPIAILLLIGIAGFVYAFYSESQNQITIPINEGWNLVSGNLIQSSRYLEFKYVYIYDLKNQDYVLLVYNGKEFDEIENVDKNLKLQKDKTINFLNRIQSDGDEAVLVSSVWAYSEKEGEMEFEWDDFQKNKLSLSGDNSLWELSSGWNFLWVTPEMGDKSLEDIKGGCNFEKAYLWDTQNQQWGTIFNLLDDKNILKDEGKIGGGFVVKVTNDCTLGTSGDGTTPPGLPGGNGECTDTDGGNNIYEKGLISGCSYEGECGEAYDRCWVDVGIQRITEYYCEDGYIKSNKPECPNGCSNGACIQ